jgi:hypothetical protein
MDYTNYALASCAAVKRFRQLLLDLSAEAKVRSQSTPYVICVVRVTMGPVFLRVPLRIPTTITPAVHHTHISFMFF